MKSIYILLTRTHTFFSNVIHLVTMEDFTHVSISLNKDLNKLYSFSRKYEHFPLPGGFVVESIRKGIYRKQQNSKCILYELKVSNKVYNDIETKLNGMVLSNKNYKYSLVGVVMCNFKIEYERNNKFFCSQFVAEILKRCNALKLPKSSSLMHPNDFRNIKELKEIYNGKICDLTKRN